MNNYIRDFTVMYATKQLLNFICINPIGVITPKNDTRRVAAYLIEGVDAQELKRWYDLHPTHPFKAVQQHPVLTGSITHLPELQKNNLLLKRNK